MSLLFPQESSSRHFWYSARMSGSRSSEHAGALQCAGIVNEKFVKTISRWHQGMFVLRHKHPEWKILHRQYFSLFAQQQRRDAVRLVLPAINIPSQEFLSNGAYLRIQLFFFERLDTVSVNFSPAFLVCRRYPELISSLNRMFLFSYYWHFIQLLSWKPSWSCRLSIFFIFRIHTSGFV